MENRIFKRKIYSAMLKWKEERQGSTALLINGARRVGKSTIAETFAKNEYESYMFIDFSEASKEVKELWDDISNLDDIFFKLQFHYDVKLVERKSVIVFDEVQDCPKARQAIRKLVKDGRYDYIETGSLLSIRKSTANIRIPSEETRITLYPMDYEEFRQAIGSNASTDLLREAFEMQKSLGDAVNRKLMRDFRLYMLVGGMPQAVNAYLESNNLGIVDGIKREIIQLYEDDCEKIDPTGKARQIFHYIPARLTGNASRYNLPNEADKSRRDAIDEIVHGLEDSCTVIMARHANDPGAALSLHSDLSNYKLFMCDTGLFTTLAFWDKAYTENVIYQKMLADKLTANLGYVFENVVAQMLKAAGHELFYYTWPSETSNHNYEIDFLLSDGEKVCPIEVKSSGYKTHASLDKFCQKFHSRISKRYLIYTKDLRKDEDITYLPVYMTQFL